ALGGVARGPPPPPASPSRYSTISRRSVSVAARPIATRRIDGALAPRHWHRRGAAMQIAPRVLGTILEPGDESHQLLDRLLVDLAALLRGCQLRLAQHARLGVTARPRDQRRRASGEQVDPVEWTLLSVEANDAALDQVTPYVVAIEVEVQRCLQLASMSATAGELALPPARQEALVNGQQVPPRSEDALGVRFQVGAASDQVEVGHVRAVAVEQHDLLE